MLVLSTIYGKTFEWENFRGYNAKWPFAGKHSRLHACGLLLMCAHTMCCPLASRMEGSQFVMESVV